MCDLHLGHVIDEKADVWALGCLLYTLAFQRHPFDTESPLQILNSRWDFPPKSTRSAELHGLVITALTPDPAKRPTVFELTERATLLYAERSSDELTGATRGQHRRPQPVPTASAHSQCPQPVPTASARPSSRHTCPRPLHPRRPPPPSPRRPSPPSPALPSHLNSPRRAHRSRERALGVQQLRHRRCRLGRGQPRRGARLWRSPRRRQHGWRAAAVARIVRRRLSGCIRRTDGGDGHCQPQCP